MSIQQQVMWKGIIMVTLTLLLIPLASFGADLDEDMIKAAYRGDTTMVKDCLAKGADINAKLKYSGWTALMLAAREGHTETVVNGRDKVSQKWSFRSEPVWRVFGNSGMLPDLIRG